MAAVAVGEVTIADQYRLIPPQVLEYYQTTYAMDAATASVFHVLNQNWSFILS